MNQDRQNCVANAVRPNASMNCRSGMVCGAEAVDGLGEDVSGECRWMRHAQNPKMPSDEEREAHALTHLPFRSWCPHCVGGRGQELPHHKSKEDPLLPEFHMDYCFPGDEEGTSPMKVLVMRERTSRMLLAVVVPKKGLSTFVANRVLAFIREVGCAYIDIIIRCDQEPAILALREDISRSRAQLFQCKSLPEESPKESHASNGIVERAVKSVEAQIRVMRSAFEERVGRKLEEGEPIYGWMVEYAAVLLNRYELGHDGKSAYERCRGKRSKLFGLEFGEIILWKRFPFGGARAKLTPLWQEGMYIGVQPNSMEILVASPSGIHRVRTFQRKPISFRWQEAAIAWVTEWTWGKELDTFVEDNDGVEADLEGSHAVPIEEDLTPQVTHPTRGMRKTAQEAEAQFRHEIEVEARKHAEEAEAQHRHKVEVEAQKRAEEAEAQLRQEVEVTSQRDAGNKGRRLFIRHIELELEQNMARISNIEQRAQQYAESTNYAVGVLELLIGEVGPQAEYIGEWAVDDLTGEPLEAESVRGARREEMDFVQKIGVYEEAEESECWRKTGKAPISTKWVDIRKGEDVRSRWVARYFREKGEGDRPDLFASMPPLEAKKLLFRKMAQQRFDTSGRTLKLMFIDVRKAHLNGKCEEEDVFVQLPAEAGAAAGKCGRLRRWLYGMRPAAQGWEDEYTNRLKGEGFQEGSAAPTAFWNAESGVSCVVHGDDFTFLGTEEELQKVRANMEAWYDVKFRGILGPEAHDVKEIVILNRSLRVTHAGLEYAADPKHAQIIWTEMGLDLTSNGVTSPCVRDIDGHAVDDAELEGLERNLFRRVCARANYLGMDRHDIQYAVKEMASDMSQPKQSSLKKLKHLARYLLYVPTFTITYAWGSRETAHRDAIEVFVDSDWAGCRRTRRSTSGGVVCVAGGAVRGWSKLQKVVALSSGEAEYYAMVSGCAEALGVQAVARDLGWMLPIYLMVDSSAAKSMASRKGLGKVRHMEVRHLWLQEVVREKRITMVKVDGRINPADTLTKPHTEKSMSDLMWRMGGALHPRSKQSWTQRLEQREHWTRARSNSDIDHVDRPLSNRATHSRGGVLGDPCPLRGCPGFSNTCNSVGSPVGRRRAPSAEGLMYDSACCNSNS